MKNKIKKSLVAIIIFTNLFGTNVHGIYYPERTVSRGHYSLVGLKVGNVTLHASGYSYANSGRVTGSWLTSWQYLTNDVRNKKTWKGGHERGEYAMGGYDFAHEVPTPWGGVTFYSKSYTLSILF